MIKTDNLVKAALIGTERVAPEIPVIEGFAEINNPEPEAKLLTAAAVAFKYNLSGQKPLRNENIKITEAETEELEAFDDNLISVVNSLFMHYPRLLGEFLEKLSEKKQLFPEFLLPKLLDEGSRNKEYHEFIIKTAGKRGLWLAKQNKAWNYLFDEEMNETETWGYETTRVRLNLLKKLRKTEPLKALELLKTTWKEETAQDKVKFLEVLENNLNSQDEEFLEMALDDKRSREVRKKAAELLALIPGSALSEYLYGNLDNLFEFTVKNKKVKPLLNLIDQPSVELARYTGTDTAGFKTLQEKESFVFEHLIPKLPLKYFTDRLKKSPEELINIFISDKNFMRVTHYLSYRTLREHNREWARIFLSYQDFGHLVRVLDKEEGKKLVQQKLAADPGKHYNMLNHLDFQWDSDFSYQVLKTLLTYHKSVKGTKNYHDYALYPLSSIAYYFSPAIAEKVKTDFLPLFTSEDYEKKLFTDFLNILEFRHEMLKELEK